jgi:glucose-1-phosphate thymidylyltransferase
MKALVLSGGLGTRLRPFTHSMAKQLVPVANKPVLRHCLDNIAGIGVTDVGVVVGARADEVVAELGDGSGAGMRITYIHQEEPLGIAHCVLLAADFLRDDDFVLYLGDNVLADGIADAALAFRTRRPDAQLLVVKVPDPRQYGVAVVDPDGTVLDLCEKPAEPRSDLAVVGVYFFTPAVHEAVRAIRPSGRGELEITDALAHMVHHGRTVTAAAYDGYWRDTGSVTDLLDCNRALLERMAPSVRGRIDAASTVSGPVVVAADAVVTRSRLVGPLVVGGRAVITDSVLGPSTSVGPDCVVTGSRVAESVLLAGAHVTGVPDLRESVVGRQAHVTGTGVGPAASVVIGDHARVEVAA